MIIFLIGTTIGIATVFIALIVVMLIVAVSVLIGCVCRKANNSHQVSTIMVGW